MYRSDVSSVKTHSIVLDDESEIAANVLLCGTGWKSAYPLFFKEQSLSLGLPHSHDEDSPEHVNLWSSLLEFADRQVLAKFSILNNSPPHKKTEASTTTARLYITWNHWNTLRW